MSMILTSDMTPDTLDDVREKAREASDYIDHVYLHWTAGHYGQAYDDYHICIDEDGSVYIMEDFRETLAHTYMRNRYAVGVSMLCCVEAEARSGYNAWLGYEPPTTAQIESLAQVVAVLAEEFNLPLDTSDYVMTHCEAADLDGYGPHGGGCERWDLWYLPDAYGADGELVPGGDLIRGKAAYYQRIWEHDEMGD